MLAPNWLLPEVANVLGKAAVVRKILTPKEAADGFAAIQGLALNLFPSAALTAQALHLAITHRRAVYDCLYVALAINEGGQLVTADQPMVNQLGAVFPFLVSLSALPS